MSQTPDQQPRPKESVDDLVPYELMFGVVHTQLGFDGIDRTAKFLQQLLGLKILTVRLVEKKDAKADESRVMKTQELPRNLRRTAKVRAKLTEDELRAFGEPGTVEAFLNVSERMRFNSEEIIAFIPLAKAVQTEGITVEEYLKRGNQKLADMRAKNRERTTVQDITRSCLFRLLAITAVAGGVAYSQYPKYMPWLEEVKEKISHIGSSPDAAATDSGSKTEKGHPGGVDSSTAVAPPTSSASPLPTSPESEPNERRRAVGISKAKRWLQSELNPEELTKQRCEEEIRVLSSPDQNHEQEALLREWNEKLTLLVIIEELERILGKMERKEPVEASEIDTIVNPDHLRLEELNDLQEKWQKPQLAAHPEQRQNLERLARLKRVIAVGEAIKKLIKQ